MIVAILALSILDLVGVLIAAAAGVTDLWPILRILPLLGLPIAMLLILVLLVINARRRSREAQLPTKTKK